MRTTSLYITSCLVAVIFVSPIHQVRGQVSGATGVQSSAQSSVQLAPAAEAQPAGDTGDPQVPEIQAAIQKFGLDPSLAPVVKETLDLERMFRENTVDPDQVDALPSHPRETLAEMPVHKFIENDPNYLVGLYSKAITFGRGRALKTLFSELLTKLSLQGDSASYKIQISGSPIPYAGIYPSQAFMIVNLGLLGLTANVDELAYVIAHEMTHENQSVLKLRQDDPRILEILNSIRGTKDLDDRQREEIRADLGAIERMIKAGYNPWAAYNLEKKWAELNRVSLDLKLIKYLQKKVFAEDYNFMSTHPLPEIRMAAIKAYVSKRTREIDLTDHVAKFTSFNKTLTSLQMQMKLMGLPFHEKTTQRLLVGFLGYNIWDLLIRESVFGKFVDHATGVAYQSIKSMSDPVTTALSDGVFKMGEALFHLTSFVTGDVADPLLAAGSLLLAGYALFFAEPSNRHGRVFKSAMRKIRNVKKHLRSGEPLDSASLISLMKVLNESLSELSELNYWRSRTFRLRRINGIDSTVYQASQMYRSIIEQIQRAPDFEGVKFQLKEQLHSAPRFIFTFKDLRRSYVEVITSIANNSIKPATTLVEYQTDLKKASDERVPMLFANLDTIDAGTPEDLKLQIAFDLYKSGFFDLSARVIGSYPHKMISAILSGQFESPDMLEKLRKILNTAKEKGFFHRDGVFKKASIDLFLIYQKLNGYLKSRSESTYTLTKGITPKGFLTGTLRKGTEAVDGLFIEQKLSQSFHSLTEVLDYLDKEVVKKGGDLQALAPMFTKILLRGKNWIQSPKDVEALVAFENLWIKFTPYEGVSRKRKFFVSFVDAIEKMRYKFPKAWAFQIENSEKIHTLIERRLKELGQFPTDPEEQFKLWKLLSSRGVTSMTDKLFSSFFSRLKPATRIDASSLAIDQGFLWEPSAKYEIVRANTFSDPKFQNMLSLPKDSSERIESLQVILIRAGDAFPEKGMNYWSLLEEISVKMESSETESSMIDKAKKMSGGGSRQEDLSLRFMSELTDEALKWSRTNQWDLIQFLRGRGQLTRKLSKEFGAMGPERVRRLFEVLPLLAKAQIIDTFIDSPRGLLRNFKADSGWGKTIVDEVFAGRNPAEVKIAKEILEGFLYSLQKSGNGPLRTYVVAYLLAQPHGEAESSSVLKNVLEIFGATGVKIGQFLAAAGVLPEKETKVLRELQDRAKVPLREEIYQEIREMMSTKKVPFLVGALKGAASIKYAVEVFNEELQKQFILKIFRLESIAHTRAEFNLLEHMSDFLEKKHGAKYGVFRSIVGASRKAVERELIVSEEAKKSAIAQRYIYINLDEEGINVKAPSEVMLADRAILSEYAEGDSFFALEDHIKLIVAKKILSMERDLLFANSDKIYFDPDRHAGNYRIHVQKYENGNHLVLENIQISAIDMGQLLSHLTREMRENVINLFALAQVFKEVGATQDLIQQVARIFNLDHGQTQKLACNIGSYFPNASAKEVTAYFSTLAALEKTGVKIDIGYFDFVRAIIQLQQYEPFVTKDRDWLTPSELFAKRVAEKAQSIVEKVALTQPEKLRYVWQKLRGNFAQKLIELGKLALSKERRAHLQSAGATLGKMSPQSDPSPTVNKVQPVARKCAEVFL